MALGWRILLGLKEVFVYRLEDIIVFSYQIMLKPIGRKSFTAHLIRMLDQKVNKFFKGNEWDILKICSKLYHDQTVFALLEGKVPHTIFSAH